MADIIKLATREGYGKALVELGEKNDKVLVLDADLAAATKTGMFKKAFPNKFIDVGIAESNL
ncbi:MAG: transketolase family protein, partial [Oscillospiraceae bacterium]